MATNLPANAEGVKGARLTINEVAALVQQVGFPASEQPTAVAIIMAESGGATNAFRPARLNPGGGNDRGLWQINDKAHPSVTADTAYNMIASTGYAISLYQRSGWGPWNYGPNAYSGRPRTDLDIGAATVAVQNPADVQFADAEMIGTGWEQVTEAVGRVTDALNPFAGVIGYLVKGLALLTSADFWKRVGLVLAGVAIIAVAVAAMLGRTGGPAGMIGSKLTGK